MSQVKRFRADHRHVVETEFDDAQFVSVADYDALQQRLTVAEQGLKTIIKRCQAGWSTEAIELEDEEALEDMALNPAEAAAPIDDQWEK